MQTVRQHCNDLLAVKPAVLDEDVAGLLPGDSTAGDKEVRHVGADEPSVAHNGITRDLFGADLI